MQPQENASTEAQKEQRDASLNRRQVLKTAGWMAPGITVFPLMNTAFATSNSNDGGTGRGAKRRRRNRI